MSVEEKKDRLSSVYKIEMTREIESEVYNMCNLSRGIANANQAIGFENGAMQTLIQLLNKGRLTTEEAAEECNITVEEFLKKKNEYEKERQKR